MAPWLAERLGQPVVIENKPGASSNISIQTVVNSPADGYTLLFVPASAAVNVTLFDTLPFNLLHDIAPVSGLIDFPLVMVANPSVPAQTVAELIAHAKANPGKISMALVRHRLDLARGRRAVQDDDRHHHDPRPLSRRSAHGHRSHQRAGAGCLRRIDGLARARAIGHVRALAVAGKRRSDVLPEVPTIGETVAGYEANSWCGLGVPRGTPPEIIERLNREINAGLADPAVRARLADVATTPIFFTPEEFGAYMAAEVEKWGNVVRLSGIRPE